MKKRLKAWTMVGAAIMANSPVQAATLHMGNTAHSVNSGSTKSVLLIADKGGEAGESGSEGGLDIADFLTDLGLMEGHLAVGYQLYKDGRLDMAKTHMKHPKDEIYSKIEAQFAHFKVDGFADELQALSDAVENGAPAAKVEARYDAVQAAIVSASSLNDGHERVEVISKLVRVAGVEFAAGVKDGQITEVHEFQDAWGFVQAAKRLLDDSSEKEKAEYAEQLAKVSAELNALDPAWPAIDGSKPTEIKSSVLAGAAARIELISIGMK